MKRVFRVLKMLIVTSMSVFEIFSGFAVGWLLSC